MASSPTRQHIRAQDPGFRKCTSMKVGYPSRAVAFDAAELMMLRGLVNPGCHITPYECAECGEWHVANRVIVPVGPRRFKGKSRAALA